jgi:uncharacterized protein DUF1905/bacteriocin resistance YdeI/OmpD-like protein
MTPGRQRFTAALTPTERGGGGHLVVVPRDVVQALGREGRIPVNATFEGIPYRGSIVSMGGGGHVLGVLKAIVEELGIGFGDSIEVTVELDTRERTVRAPRELLAPMKREPSLKEAWDGLSFTRRKELASSIEDAKKPETRTRRLEKALQELRTRAPGS